MKKLELQDISPKYHGVSFENAQMLQDYAQTHKISEELQGILKTAEKTVLYKRTPIDMKEFPTYEQSFLPVQALNRIDQNTDASVLLLTSPFAKFPSKEEYMVKDMTMHELKDRMTHRTVRGGTLIYPNAPTRHEKIAQAIRAYDEQIVALAKEKGIIRKNMFFFHMEERKALVQEHQREIIECLCALEASPIWGSLANDQKRMLLSGIRSKRHNTPLEKALQTLTAYMTEYEICHDVEKGISKVMKK